MVMRAMQLDCGEPSSELVRGLTTDLQYARATELKKETQKKEKDIYIYIYRRKLGLSDSTKENNDYVRELYRKRNSF